MKIIVSFSGGKDSQACLIQAANKSFIDALNPHDASNLYDLFNQKLSDALGKKVKTGIFGEDMKLHIVCDGPVTISLEY